MKRRFRFTLNTLIWALMLLAAYAATTHAQTSTTANQPAVRKNSAAQAIGDPVVNGTGTVGQLPKWTSLNGIGDSIITETKLGNIGIGTTAPGSKLSVQGLIETTLGGYKFPDGTVQTTALSAGQVVSSLNGLKGNVQLAAGTNITITPNGNTLTIAAPNALTGVSHDSTLTGSGTASTPLKVAVPLFLSGAVSSSNNGVLNVENNAPGEVVTIFARGGPASSTGIGGVGLFTVGGAPSSTNQGGVGLFSQGGDATAANVNGNSGSISQGGDGENGSGGRGIIVIGGTGSGTGHRGGTALDARAGTGSNGAKDGLAGDFSGDVVISGNLAKGGGSFKIDHPLDPENKYLYHSFVESPDMMNIYNGTVTTDANGDATVTLPDWFEALNQDFRYQLTVIGTFAQAIVAQKVKGNRFTVKTNAPNVEVSWQLTGIRHDAYANKHRIPVEEQKSEDERGLYLHPDAFNQPEDKGVQFVKFSAAREQAKQPSQPR